MYKVSSHLSVFFGLYAELTKNYLIRWFYKTILSQLMWGPHLCVCERERERERKRERSCWEYLGPSMMRPSWVNWAKLKYILIWFFLLHAICSLFFFFWVKSSCDLIFMWKTLVRIPPSHLYEEKGFFFAFKSHKYIMMSQSQSKCHLLKFWSRKST